MTSGRGYALSRVADLESIKEDAELASGYEARWRAMYSRQLGLQLCISSKYTGML